MIVNMKGEPVNDSSPDYKMIEIRIDSRLESERIKDLCDNYLTPFMQQLQVPYLNVIIHE